MQYKMIYLARRNPALTADEFPEAWRSHSRLASTFSNTMGKHFTGVSQCIKVRDIDVPDEYRNSHDGSALISMKSWDDLVAARSHPDATSAMKADEVCVFADYVSKWTMAARELVCLERGKGRSLLLHFFTRRDDVSQRAFLDEWNGAHARRIQALPIVAERARRFVLNEVVEAPPAPYNFAGVSELWFDDVADAQAAANDPALRGAIRTVETVVDPARGVALVARLNLQKAAATDASGQIIWTSQGPAGPE